MSSLQKFHRRTLVAAGKFGSEAPVAGSGFYLGLAGDGTSFMYVAPKSTEVQRAWGSPGTVRGTISTTNGVANTNTLYAFGNSITTGHPAAYYCKTLTTGGYNTWYLPAKNELNTLYANKSATPFATANSFLAEGYLCSTESTGSANWVQLMGSGIQQAPNGKDYGAYYVRATRRSTI